MARPLADFVISLGTDGHIMNKGSAAEVFANMPELVEEVKHEEEAIELDENEVEQGNEAVKADDKKGKLVVAEEIEVGHVSSAACAFFLQRANWTASDFVYQSVCLLMHLEESGRSCFGLSTFLGLVSQKSSTVWRCGGLATGPNSTRCVPATRFRSHCEA